MRVFFSKIQTKEGKIGDVLGGLFSSYLGLYPLLLLLFSLRVCFSLISSAILTFVDFWFLTPLDPLHIFNISQLLVGFSFSHQFNSRYQLLPQHQSRWLL